MFPEEFISDDGGEFVFVGWCRSSVVLFTRRQSKKRKRNDASVLPKIGGLVVELRLLCPAVPILGWSISSRQSLLTFLTAMIRDIDIFGWQ